MAQGKAARAAAGDHARLQLDDRPRCDEGRQRLLRQCAEYEIELAVEEPREDQIVHADHELDDEPREALLQACHGAWHDGGAEVWTSAYAQAPGLAGAKCLHLDSREMALRFDAVGVRKERPAEAGQCRAARQALEQRDSEALFEL